MYARIRRTLTSHLGRGSFVLIAYKGVVALRIGRHAKRLHAFFVFVEKELRFAGGFRIGVILAL